MLNFFRWIVDFLVTVINNFFGPFFRVFKAVLVYIAQQIVEWWILLKDLVIKYGQMLFQYLENAFIWISDVVLDAFLSFLTWALDKIVPVSETETFSEVISNMRNILAAFDVFLPIHEIFGYIGVLLLAWITCLFIRVVMSLIIRILVAAV